MDTIKIISELEAIKATLDALTDAQEAAAEERRRLFRSILQTKPQDYNRPRNTIGAIEHFRARGGRLRP